MWCVDVVIFFRCVVLSWEVVLWLRFVCSVICFILVSRRFLIVVVGWFVLRSGMVSVRLELIRWF